MVLRLSLSLIALGTALGLVGPRSPRHEPPNSLDPGAKGKLKLSHEHRRALACTAKREKNEVICTADRRDADSATSLTLLPIRPARIAVKDKRQTVTVNFSSQRGRQEKTLDLGFGEWEVEWSGLEPRPRFRVESADEFEVELRTLTGKCKKSNDECVLEPGAASKECKIPSGRRVAAD
jgi:hypothetical protein